MGAFDDLIPTNNQGAGAFSDLVPADGKASKPSPVTGARPTRAQMQEMAYGFDPKRNPLKTFAYIMGHGMASNPADQATDAAGDVAYEIGRGAARNVTGPVAPAKPMEGVVGQYARGVGEGAQGAVQALPGGRFAGRVVQRIQDEDAPAAAPRNALERGARIGGRMTSGTIAGNALIGGPVRVVKSIVLPTLGATAGGEIAKAAGADEGGQAVGEFIGGAAGGVLASIEPRANRPGQTAENALGRFRAKTRPDVERMRTRAAEYRDAGIEPTLVDVTDESGRGYIRHAASKMTPGREVAQDFADSRALNLPDRMSQQARRVMSQDPRTPAQIATALARERRTQADAAFGAVRNETVDMAPETAQALRTDHGREAIREAIRRERDPSTRAALSRLTEDALDRPNTPITVGMADRVSRVLLGRARAAARAGDDDLASTLTGLGRGVRDPVAGAVAGYTRALEGYAEASRTITAAGRGEEFLNRNTDEFVADTGAMTAPQRNLARATARRAVERAAGENVGSAPGVARRIADAPEQQARNRALLGPEDAVRLERGMRLEARASRNALDIAPRTGSQTFGRAQDAAEVADNVGLGVRAVGRAKMGDVVGGTIDAMKLWMRMRGLSNAQAEELVRIATTPGRTDEAIATLAQITGRPAAQRFLQQFGGNIQQAGTQIGRAARSPVPALTAAAAISGPTNALGQERRPRGP